MFRDRKTRSGPGTESREGSGGTGRPVLGLGIRVGVQCLVFRDKNRDKVWG